MNPVRFLKDRVKSALAHRGYELYRRPYLPKGVDPFENLHGLWPQWHPRIMFDVGANVGQTVERLHPLFPEAIIHAFEPIPSTFARLQANVAKFPRVHPHRLAMSDRTGESWIPLSPSSELNSLNPHVIQAAAPAAKTVRIELETLAGFCTTHAITHIDLLKVDVEGHELPVLSGARPLLEAGAVDFIVIEAGLMPVDTRFTPLPAIIAALQPYDFCLVGLYEQLGWRYLESAEFCNALFALRKHFRLHPGTAAAATAPSS